MSKSPDASTLETQLLIKRLSRQREFRNYLFKLEVGLPDADKKIISDLMDRINAQTSGDTTAMAHRLVDVLNVNLLTAIQIVKKYYNIKASGDIKSGFVGIKKKHRKEFNACHDGVGQFCADDTGMMDHATTGMGVKTIAKITASPPKAGLDDLRFSPSKAFSGAVLSPSIADRQASLLASAIRVNGLPNADAAPITPKRADFLGVDRDSAGLVVTKGGIALAAIVAEPDGRGRIVPLDTDRQDYNIIKTAALRIFSKESIDEDITQQFITAGDDRVCPSCDEYDEEIFTEGDPEMPDIPLHFGCRCDYEESYNESAGKMVYKFKKNGKKKEFNDCHNPGGDGSGGQFCSDSSGGSSMPTTVENVKQVGNLQTSGLIGGTRRGASWTPISDNPLIKVWEPIELSNTITPAQMRAGEDLFAKSVSFDNTVTAEGLAEEIRQASFTSYAAIGVTDNMSKDILSKLSGDSQLQEARAKGPVSAVTKQVTKADKYPSFRNLDDFAGMRVIAKGTNAIPDMRDAVSELRTRYTVTQHDDFVDDGRLDGYRGIHLNVKDTETGVVAEIQLRTPNQDTWAHWSWSNLYKNENLPDNFRTVIDSNKDSANTYARGMSDYYHQLDIGQKAPAPDCPEFIINTVGCLPK